MRAWVMLGVRGPSSPSRTSGGSSNCVNAGYRVASGRMRAERNAVEEEREAGGVLCGADRRRRALVACQPADERDRGAGEGGCERVEDELP